MLIVIPTRLEAPNTFMLKSAGDHFSRFGIKTLLIATGSSAAQPWHASKSMLVIPLPVAKSLVDDVCAGAAFARYDLFGAGIPNLGFGGSSNLSLLIAILCDRPWWIKLDDDCHILGLAMDGVPDGTVGVGTLVESSVHPKALLAAAYPEIFSHLRLSSAQWAWPSDLKNGALLISSTAAQLAPYPVMYSMRMRVSLRGEAYDWADRLLALGAKFSARPDFRVQHFREAWDKNEWITQILLKADIVLARAAAREGIRLNSTMRHQNLTAALMYSGGVDAGDFRPLHGKGEIYTEALKLALRGQQVQPLCEALWQRAAASADQLRMRWIMEVPRLEADLFGWIT